MSAGAANIAALIDKTGTYLDTGLGPTTAQTLRVALPNDTVIQFGGPLTLDTDAHLENPIPVMIPGDVTVNLTRINGNLISLGQTVSASSLPVVLASDSSLTVTGSLGRSWTLASGTDSVAAVQSGTWTVQQGSAPWSVSQSGTWNIGTVSTITNVVHVDDNAGSLTVDNAGTFAVQASQAGTWTVQQGTAPWSENITQFGGSALSTGTGTGGAGIPRVTVSSDSSLTSVGTITNALPSGTNLLGKVGIDQTTPGTTNGVVSTTQDVLVTGSLLAADTGSVVATGQSGSSVITGTATASAVIATTMSGISDVTVRISGVWQGSLQFEISSDNGSTWGIASLIVIGTNSILTGVTQNGTFIANTSGASNFRVRAVTLIAGTPIIAINKTQTSGVVYLGNQTLGQSLESGGNLDFMAGSMKKREQMIELQIMQVGLLRSIYIVLASIAGQSPEIDMDDVFSDATLQ